MSNNRSGQFIGGLLLGGAIGVVTGLLLAPRSGRQTRQFLKKSVEALPELAEDISTSVQIQADRLSESTKSSWDETLARVKSAIAVGIEAGIRENEFLSQEEEIEDPSPLESGNLVTEPNGELKETGTTSGLIHNDPTSSASW